MPCRKNHTPVNSPDSVGGVGRGLKPKRLGQMEGWAAVPQKARSRVLNITGRRFGRLRVLGINGLLPDGRIGWRCLCRCGGLRVTRAASLLNGATRSCGCLAIEMYSKRMLAMRTHCMTGTRLANSWFAMMARCYRPNSAGYRSYGGRGIAVCDWIKLTPKNLLNLIGDRPRGKTLDRINSNGHYSCGACKDCQKRGLTKNVRWATPAEQVRNRSVTHLVAIGGAVKSINEWAAAARLNWSTIARRIDRGATGKQIIRPRSQGVKFVAP